MWLKNFQESKEVLDKILLDEFFLENCKKFSEKFEETIQNNHKFLSCGNGGSYCDSLHFSEELTGRFKRERRGISAIALGNAAHSTCMANDYSFDEIFAREVQAHGRRGDLLLAISTSGNSENVLRAVREAKKIGIYTVALLGKDGGKILKEADLSLVVPSQSTERIQEVHIKIIHNVIDTWEISEAK